MGARLSGQLDGRCDARFRRRRGCRRKPRGRPGPALARVFGAFPFLPPHPGFGEPVVVPAELQAELVAKLLPYDRSFRARAADEVVVLLVVKPRSAESAN